MTTIAIVSHRSRQMRALRLGLASGAEKVFTDDGTLGPGYNHDRVWRWLAGTDGDWSVVLEDDAIVKEDFQNQLEMVLEAAPSSIVSLYLGRSRPPHWQPQIMRVIARPEHFLLSSALLHHVGVAMCTDLINDMLASRDRWLPVDESVSKWAWSLDEPIAYCHPSIVDHDYTLPPTILERVSGWAGEPGQRHEVRKAWCFGSREAWRPTFAKIPDPDI